MYVRKAIELHVLLLLLLLLSPSLNRRKYGKTTFRIALQYCVSVWNQYLLKDIKLIEDVQRRAAELVQGNYKKLV